MSTRAFICYVDNDGNIRGTFNHWDGYPDWLGKKIVEVAEKKFIDNRGTNGVPNNVTIEQALEAFIQVYIKGHPGGWNVFDEECYCHTPEYVLRDGFIDATCLNNECFEMCYTYIIIPNEAKMEVYQGRHKLISVYDFKERKWTNINNND